MATVFRVLALIHNAEFVATRRITQGQRYTGSAAVATPGAIERNPLLSFAYDIPGDQGLTGGFGHIPEWRQQSRIRARLDRYWQRMLHQVLVDKGDTSKMLDEV